MRGHPPAAVDLLAVERTRALGGRIVAHLCERPREVHRRRPRGGEHALGCLEILAAERGEREAVGGGDADRGRAAHDHRADGVRHLGRGAARELDLLVRQLALVEEDDPGAVLLQPDDVLGSQVAAQVPSSQDARYLACSSVSVSMSTPMVASFRRAISLSISAGTG